MVGCAAALALRKRGYSVTIYEKRADPRSSESKEVGRSINLAISARGLSSLESIDAKIASEVRAQTVPMVGRMLHLADSDELEEVKYGVFGDESINSISRSELNNILINAAEAAGAEIKFDYKVPKTRDEMMELGSTVFGCDGTFSVVRDVITRNADYKLDMEVVPTYYMEVPIPKCNLSMNHLHIWPRGEHMFIALPNLDGTFTGTLFAPSNKLNKLDGEALAIWFASEFPDAALIIGQGGLDRLGADAPRGKLTSLKFFPYNLRNEIILLGDSSHSMVPFYGQGLNAGLEDVKTLFEFIDKNSEDWERAFNEYSEFRKPDLDAINDLSMANYLEMSSSVATLKFKLRKKVDNQLSKWLGDKWMPLYTMVSFRNDVRYSRALETSKWQNKLINNSLNVVGGCAALAVAAAIYKLKKSK